MDTDPQIVYTMIAAAIVVVSVLWASLLSFRSRPGRPTPGPSTIDLPEESPALVDFLTDDFSLTQESLPATLLDLSARRWLLVEEVAGGNVIIRLRRREPDNQLAPYERRLLDHVRALEVDGVIPAEAITTGHSTASSRWWRDFRREVVAEAQQRGLSRDKWTLSRVASMWIGVFAAGIFLWLADESGEPAEVGELPGAAKWVWIVSILAVVVMAAWLAFLLDRDVQRDTEDGLKAASRWLGVRDYLDTYGDFGEKPAASVVLWERQLAYAVALGLAPLARDQLPLGEEDHRHAWSRASGRWRQVQVRYPWFRPGYGQSPALAVLGAFVGGAFAVAVLVLTTRYVQDRDEAVDDLTRGASQLVDAAALTLAAIAALALIWNSIKAYFAVRDLFNTAMADGIAIRCRVRRGSVGLHPEPETSSDDETRQRYFLAFDTGKQDVVVAWRVRRQIYQSLRQGERYNVEVTPRLRYVRSVAPPPA